MPLEVHRAATADVAPVPPVSPESVRRQILAPEVRSRLLRFCAQLSGDYSGDVAEDLTQQTLLLAYQQADRLRRPESWQPWLFGIARNLYLRWNRAQVQELKRRAFPSSPFSSSTEFLETLTDQSFDLDEALERAEITEILGRAMSALSGEVRDMLADFYVEDMPQAEIAARHGMTENNAAVRLHRGKRALRKILTTTLRDEAAAFGLIAPEQEVLQETRLWCPYCGQGHLLAPALNGKPKSSAAFKLRCSACGHMMGPRVIDFPSDCIFAHPAFDASEIIGNVRGFKPAINRLSIWWHGYLQDGVRKGWLPCLGCGKPVSVSAEKPGHLSKTAPWRGLQVACERCRNMHVLMPNAFTLCAPPVQEFWKRHRRVRHLPPRPLQGEDAFLIRVESLASNAHIDVLFFGKTRSIVCFSDK